MSALVRAWRQAVTGDPTFVMILADSGFGKSRLVHEFYARLSRHARRKGHTYWPARIDADVVRLRVNPHVEDSATTSQAPCLWWGMRWHDPNRRNANDLNFSAILSSDAQQALRQHVAPLLALKLREERGIAAMNKFLAAVERTALGLLAFGEYMGAVRDLYEIYQSEKEWEHTPGAPTGDSHSAALEAFRSEIETTVFGFLASLLGGKGKNPHRTPVVIFLDDVQWADAVSLRFVRRLMTEGQRSRWPLLIVATCWEGHWKEQRAATRPGLRAGDEPGGIAELVSQLDVLLSPRPWLKTVRLDRFMDREALAPLLESSFRGLGPEARDYLLTTAYGNPKVLVELLAQLHERARNYWFVDHDMSKDLSASGLVRLRLLPREHEDILHSRLKRLDAREPDVRKTLTLGAFQGMSFFARLIDEVIEHVSLGLDSDVGTRLARAEDPHNLISNSPGTLGRADFREYLTRVILMDWLGPELSDRVRSAVKAVLVRWLGSSEFGRSEQGIEVANLLLESMPLEPEVASGDWRLRATVLGGCVQWLRDRHRRSEALVCANRLWDLIACDLEHGVSAVRVRERPALVRSLVDAKRYDRAVAVVEVALSAAPGGEELLSLLEAAGEAHLAREDYPSAERDLARALELASQDSWRDRRVEARLNLALGESYRGRDLLLRARAQFAAALRAIDPDRRDTWTGIDLVLAGRALERLGSTNVHLSYVDLAIDQLTDSLDCLARADEATGDRPPVLEEMAKTLIGLGDIYLMSGGERARQADAHFSRALDLRMELLKWTGQTPGLSSAIASAYSYHASGLWALDDKAGARDSVRRALAMRRDALASFGEHTETIRSLSYTLMRCGAILERGSESEQAEATRCYEEAIALRVRILHEIGPTSINLILLQTAQRKSGEAAQRAGDLAGSIARLEQARSTLRRAIRASSARPEESLATRPDYFRNRSRCQELLAEAHEAVGVRAIARSRLRAALRFNEIRLTRFEPTAAARADQNRMERRLADLPRIR
jgi:tetratricopeptide (TPR) repeat protein